MHKFLNYIGWQMPMILSTILVIWSTYETGEMASVLMILALILFVIAGVIMRNEGKR